MPCGLAVRAGSAVMDAILGAWPTAQVLSTYGPWLSTSESHAHVSFLPDFAKENPIVGSFIVGFMQSLHQHRTSRAAADEAAPKTKAGAGEAAAAALEGGAGAGAGATGAPADDEAAGLEPFGLAGGITPVGAWA